MKKIKEVKDTELEKVVGGSLAEMKIIGPKQMGPDGMSGSGGNGRFISFIDSFRNHHF